MIFITTKSTEIARYIEQIWNEWRLSWELGRCKNLDELQVKEIVKNPSWCRARRKKKSRCGGTPFHKWPMKDSVELLNISFDNQLSRIQCTSNETCLKMGPQTTSIVQYLTFWTYELGPFIAFSSGFRMPWNRSFIHESRKMWIVSLSINQTTVEALTRRRSLKLVLP